MTDRIYKSRQDKVIDGVCGGIANYFNIDPTLVRLAFVFFALAYGGSVIAYIICMIVIPAAPATNSDGSPFNEGVDHIVADPELQEKKRAKTKQIIGIVLVALGAMMLLDNYTFWFSSELIWGLGVVGIGIYLIVPKAKTE